MIKKLCKAIVSPLTKVIDKYKNNPRRILKNLYFIKQGDKLGQFIIILDFNEKDRYYSVLSMPEGDAEMVSEADIKLGIKNKYIDYVKRVPNFVYETCKKEFNYKLNKVNS